MRRLGMRVVLDTNAYSDWRRSGKWNDVLARATEVWIPVIVIGELRAGFRRSKQAEKNERKLADFLAFPVVHVAEITEGTTRFYAEFKKQLKDAGTPIPENDVWIAACCREHSLPLLTADAHFEHLPQVEVLS